MENSVSTHRSDLHAMRSAVVMALCACVSQAQHLGSVNRGGAQTPDIASVRRGMVPAWPLRRRVAKGHYSNGHARNAGKPMLRQWSQFAVPTQGEEAAARVETAMEAVEEQAPFLRDTELMTKDVLYSCPLEYTYARQVGKATQGDSMFTSKLEATNYAEVVNENLRRLERIPGYRFSVTRKFKASPDVLICRWTASLGTEDRRTDIHGSTKYTLQDGKVHAIEENWKTDPESEGNKLFDAFQFQLARRPVGQSEYSLEGIVPGYRYAMWEGLLRSKDFPKDEVTRADADEASAYILYAALGLVGFDVFLVFAKLIKTFLLHR